MTLLRGNAVALLCAVFFGIILAGPFILVASDSSFSGVFPELVNDQNYYLSRIQEVRDGFTASGNTYLAEHKDTPALQPQTGENVIAFVLNLSGLPTATILIFGALFFGTLTFFLLYLIVKRLGTPTFWALCVTIIICFGSHFFDFARPISPQFNILFWLLAVYGLLSMPERPGWKWITLQSLGVGILFYLYPYYWTHIGLTYALLFCIYLFSTNRAKAWALLASGIGSLIVAIPYILSLFSARTLPFFEETYARLGFIHTHWPSGYGALAFSLVVLGVFGFLLWRRRVYSHEVLITGALLVAGLLAMNQHIVTGLNMEFSSHYDLQITIARVLFVVAVMTLFGMWARFGKNTHIAGAVIVLVLIVVSMASPYLYAEKQISASAPYSEHGKIASWVQEHVESGAVVYAPEALASVIPAYTSANVFYARNANLFFVPQSEVVDRFIIQNYGTDFTDEFIRENERLLFGVHYVNEYNHASLRAKALSFVGIDASVPERLPQSETDAVKMREVELRKIPLLELLDTYNVAYVIADKTKTPAMPPEFKEMFQTENFIISSRLVQQ